MKNFVFIAEGDLAKLKEQISVNSAKIKQLEKYIKILKNNEK